MEIRLHGRRGQGVRLASRLLADALFRAGAWTQTLVDEGPPPGGGVSASLRVHARPIRPAGGEEPQHLLVFDPALLGDGAAGIASGGTVTVNAPIDPCSRMPYGSRVVVVDAAAIAARAGLGPLVASALLGAFSAVTRLVSLPDLVAAVEHGSLSKRAQHVRACTEAYQEAEGRRPTSLS